jgi:hypothetical protein
MVGIATRYGLDGPGIKSRWGRDFSHPSRPAMGPAQPPIQWVPDLSPGVKRLGRGVPIVRGVEWAPGPVWTGAGNLTPHRESLPVPSSP